MTIELDNSAGWVKLHRRMLEWPYFYSHKTAWFFLWCLLKATHKPYRTVVGNTEVRLEPGEFIYGRKAASIETGLSERELRTVVSTLNNANSIKTTTHPTNHFSVITILNWKAYQTIDLLKDQLIDQPATSQRPASDHKQEHKEHKEVTIDTLCAQEIASDGSKMEPTEMPQDSISTPKAAEIPHASSSLNTAKVCAKSAASKLRVSWSESELRFVVPAKLLESMKRDYPTKDVEAEIRKAGQWHAANRRWKSNFNRALASWLERAADRPRGDRYGNVTGNQSFNHVMEVLPWE